jgi:cytochrome c
MNVSNAIWIAAALLVLPLASIGADQDGAALYRSRACVGCHGDLGARPALPQYPRLACQNAEYLERQIRDIRDGRRTNAMSAAMRATVAGLRDSESEAISRWLAGLAPSAARGDGTSLSTQSGNAPGSSK